MATIDLTAERRTVLGKKVKQLRRSGVVPANIYGHHVESTPIQAPAHELRRVLRAAGHTNLVRISLAGAAPATTIVRHVSRAATTGELVHVDFQAVSMTETMTVRVPVLLVGHAPITDADGMVVPVLDGIEIECLPGDIPQHFELDVSGMDSSTAVLHVRDVALPENVTLLSDPDLVLASVTMASTEEAAEAIEEAGAEPVEVSEEAPAAEERPAE
ncbi:MAG TPA: 50S ribosomal protein L25 [Dehalococcoidia bacterium]|jgi:large subunit ribosomal protein L25|nr:50S ribosomal protein L25 [Dehalococcoidia bacterium]